MKHVILTTKDNGDRSYALVDPAVSATEWHEPMELGAAPRAGMFVHEIVHGSKTAAAKKDPPQVLDLSYAGALVVREDVARGAFAGAEVELQPIDIRRAHGVVTTGWVYVAIRRWALLDPKLVFRAPPARIFRIVEAPRTIVAEPAFVKQLARATKNGIGSSDDPDDIERFAPEYAKYSRIPPDALSALRSALESGSSDATRAAACAHPVTAAAYAVLVDRAAHLATRKASSAEITSAVRYATALDRAIPDALAKQMLKSGFWDEENIVTERATLEELKGAPSGPKQVATRNLPPIKKSLRFDASMTKKHRGEIDTTLTRGLSLLGLDPTASAPEVIDALHGYVDTIRHGDAKATADVRRALSVVLGEQLHRGLGWTWIAVDQLRSVDGRTTHVPSELIARVAKKGAAENTIALFFNMLAAGAVPRGQVG